MFDVDQEVSDSHSDYEPMRHHNGAVAGSNHFSGNGNFTLSAMNDYGWKLPEGARAPGPVTVIDAKEYMREHA